MKKVNASIRKANVVPRAAGPKRCPCYGQLPTAAQPRGTPCRQPVLPGGVRCGYHQEMFDAIDRRACEGLRGEMREEGLLDAPTERSEERDPTEPSEAHPGRGRSGA
jgi:hypothetical protein